ncbi:MAG: hypothetical protein J6A69_00170 [Clostridia bacterium]|nr:hypothetical protein [Clostridia bacterium]
MKKTFLRILLILGYCIPFVFLAMNEDATFGTLWFYLIMAVGFSYLSYVSAKSKNTWIIVIGNILSFVSTCLFAWYFQTEKWEYYFKPFLPNQLIIFETVIAVVVQIIIAKTIAKKYKEGEKK